MTIVLGTALKWKKKRTRHRVVKVKDTFQYVLLLDSLKVRGSLIPRPSSRAVDPLP